MIRHCEIGNWSCAYRISRNYNKGFIIKEVKNVVSAMKATTRFGKNLRIAVPIRHSWRWENNMILSALYVIPWVMVMCRDLAIRRKSRI